MLEVIVLDHPNIVQRFFSHLTKTRGCWKWNGSTTQRKDGSAKYGVMYGGFGVPRGRHLLAHRVSYLLHYGIPEDGKWILHRCGNSLCVNPKHLYSGTVFDNNQDTVRHGRFHNMKLNEKKVRWIRRYQDIMSQEKMAKRFKVSTDTIQNVIHRKDWKWVI